MSRVSGCVAKLKTLNICRCYLISKACSELATQLFCQYTKHNIGISFKKNYFEWYLFVFLKKGIPC